MSMRMRMKIIDMFLFPLLFFSSSLKDVKPPVKSGRGNKQPKSPYMDTQNLFVRKVLTFHQSSQKKIHTSRHLREELESHLTSILLTASGTINHCRLIRKRLESHFLSNCQSFRTRSCYNQRHGFRLQPAITVFKSFINISDILKVTFLPIKIGCIDYLVWYRYCYYTGIKN